MGKIADLSFYQGDIDFKKAKTELDLAIIRVQYGSKVIDKKYKEYVEGCKANNIPFGFYAYARYINMADAKQEATDFLNRIDKAAKFLVVDVEEVTVRDKKDLVPATQMFIDTCKKAGYKVGLYTGEYFYQSNGLDKVKADFLWIAKYSTKAPTIPYDLWQYSDIGHVAGIDGNVDLNRIGNKSLEWFIGTSPKPVSAPQPKPDSHIILPNGVLKLGDKGPSVKQLQTALNQLHFNCGNPDGDFGAKTKDAVMRFQKVYLPYEADGIYGKNTRTKMSALLK